jgi:cob(I)alamin adenosyltransferase
MSSKIYTKTGDRGKTSLIGGTKVPKSHIRIESYGTIDELNSYIGLLNDQLTAINQPVNASFAGISAFLKEIQDRLFTVGSSLACDPEKELRLRIPDLKKEDVEGLETAIDQMNEALPPLRSFILPGGHVAVSTAHVTRCVCRRAERLCVHMQEEHLYIEPVVLQYLNRLSDYLFILARHIAHCLQLPEISWKPRV